MTPNKKTILAYENDDVELIPTFEKKGYRTTPILYVNGERVRDSLAAQARSNQTLLSFLRETLHLTGSKLGCAEGGCGACTVMISKLVQTTTTTTTDEQHSLGTPEIKHYSVNACLMPVLAADGCHVTTVEGVGTVQGGGQMHPVQHAMVDMHGSQCGFCTPGIIVSIYTLLSSQTPTVDHMEEHLDGNLCRCTGYRPIWDAARALCDDNEGTNGGATGPCGTACRDCSEKEACNEDCNIEDKQCCSSTQDKMKEYKDTFLSTKNEWRNQPNDMFPKELIDPNSLDCVEIEKPLIVVDQTGENDAYAGTWFTPTTLYDMLSLLKKFGSECKIVVGNTEIGIETRFKYAIYPRLINPSQKIAELYGLQVSETSVVIGSCCPLSTIQSTCGHAALRQPRTARTVEPIHDMLRWFASTQIRNVACLGGNLVTASPISDMNPMLAALGAKLTLSSLENDTEATMQERVVNVSEFFVKYRTVDLRIDELVQHIEVPVVQEFFEYVRPFKQARRREDDISIVTSGMRVKLNVSNDKYIIKDIALAFGGMSPTTVMADATAQSMIGEELCSATFERAQDVLLDELLLPEAVPGGQAAYRVTLAASFLHKFYLSIVEDLAVDVKIINKNPSMSPIEGPLPAIPLVNEHEAARTSNFLREKKPKYSGTQVYPTPKVAKGLEESILPPVKDPAAQASVVGTSFQHMSGPLHCTGEAVYTDDLPLPQGTLYGTLVLASACGGMFEAMDTSPALEVPGVVAVYTLDDLLKLGGSNELGPIVHDEVIFLPIGEKVRTVGQVLGICVAETLESSEIGARKVKVQLGEPTEKIIVTVDDAIQANSFYEFSRHFMERGDADILSKLASMPDSAGVPEVGDVVKVSGSFHSGAQEHFYLETNSSLVIPSENDLTIYASTQACTKTQKFCAAATGTPESKVTARTKRMGGGFGGKETRSVFVSAAAAVAAKTANRPVRVTLSRKDDMKLTGTRHVFVSKYEASAQITEIGADLLAFDVKLYANAGCGFDLSGPVVDRALFHVDGCYLFPNFRAEGVPCKTVQPAHTAFRGFGGPQGIIVAEHVMDHLALACQVPGDTLRRTNMYRDGDHAPFGMVIGETSWNVPKMWDKLYSKLDVPKRRAAIEDFNTKNKWIKRGLSFLPTKFGIAFTAKFMNQGGALVHVYTDGTVLVSHGGTEMGQGLHTKVCQVAAQAFGIPLKDVYVNDTSTDKVANTMPTAASMSTDMYGMSTLNACRQILNRLEPFYEQLGPDALFKDIVNTAHFARVDLSAHGFFALDDARCGFDWDMKKPDDYPSEKPENSWKGQPFNYFTQGVVCTEVEVDVLSGNHRTIQSDVLVDVGASINPAIDIGQIEGAFIQGMGWSTIEEVIYACDDHTWVRPRGAIFTTGPGTYKIPAFNDVPEVFNVSLMHDVNNPFAVHSSKAIGEPPFFLGASVYSAIKDAISAARQQNLGENKYFEMRLPATSERIRMYSGDMIAAKVVSKMQGKDNSYKEFQPQGTF